MILNEEVLFTEIMSRLNVKELIHVALVCKRWFWVITTPGYFQSQLASTSLNLYKSTSFLVNNHKIGSLNKYESRLIIFHDNGSTFYRADSTITRFEGSRLIGSIDGLVCLSSKYEFFIWNPVTQFYKTIPKNNIFKEKWKIEEDSGFCYDPIMKDYKIIYFECYESLSEEFGERMLSLRVRVYSCKLDMWKEIRDHKLPITDRFRNVCNVNGSRPFFKFNSDPNVLVAFDVHSEVLKCLPYPDVDNIEGYIGYSYDMNDMDFLSIVARNDDEPFVSFIYTLDESCDAWIEHYEMPDCEENPDLAMSLMSRFHNGDITTEDCEENVLLFKAESNQFKDKISEFFSDSFEVMGYTESLVWIEGMRRLKNQTINVEHQRITYYP